MKRTEKQRKIRRRANNGVMIEVASPYGGSQRDRVQDCRFVRDSVLVYSLGDGEVSRMDWNVEVTKTGKEDELGRERWRTRIYRVQKER